jgi:ERCC4-type nuclease
MLVVDTNAAERDLFQAICDFNDDTRRLVGTGIFREPLAIGDAALCDDDGETVWTFEIKRGNDWPASILDHRLYEQRLRAQLNPTVGEFAYIYEGKFPKNDSTIVYGRLQASAVYGSIMRTSLRDGIHVFHTMSTHETAQLLVFALAAQRKGKLQLKGSPTAGELGVVKRKRDWATDHAMEAALLSIPGMGTTHAEALSTKYERLANLLQADEQEIADVKTTNGRRVGNALAKKVKAL